VRTMGDKVTSRTRVRRPKSLFLKAGIIFAVVALAHALRIYMEWPVGDHIRGAPGDDDVEFQAWLLNSGSGVLITSAAARNCVDGSTLKRASTRTEPGG
jgi:hypothetical protein